MRDTHVAAHGTRTTAAGETLTAPGVTALMNRVVAARTRAHMSIVLRGIPANVATARRFAATALAGCPRADDLVLAVSELATNAIAWSASGCGGTFTVRVRTAPRWARVEVTDQGPAPVPAASGNGFGLGLVAEVTDRAGHSIGAMGSRTAWAEVTWPDEGRCPHCTCDCPCTCGCNRCCDAIWRR
jgi:anti-sigma regulatory factor (Ser/Thr protein kinase)